MAKNILRLPQGNISFSSYFDEEYLLISGGRPPTERWLRKAATTRRIWAVDKGLELCYQYDLTPEFIMGDGDSAAAAVWTKGKNSGQKIKVFPTAKDFTDIQLALDELIKIPGHNACIIAAAFGGRFDHAFSTVFSAAYSANCCVLADEKEILFYVRNGQTVSFDAKDTKILPYAVSLLPISGTCDGVTTKNLRWQLKNALLNQCLPNAVSNEPTEDNFAVAVEKGCLAVCLCFA